MSYGSVIKTAIAQHGRKWQTKTWRRVFASHVGNYFCLSSLIGSGVRLKSERFSVRIWGEAQNFGDSPNLVMALQWGCRIMGVQIAHLRHICRWTVGIVNITVQPQVGCTSRNRGRLWWRKSVARSLQIYFTSMVIKSWQGKVRSKQWKLTTWEYSIPWKWALFNIGIIRRANCGLRAHNNRVEFVGSIGNRVWNLTLLYSITSD